MSFDNHLPPALISRLYKDVLYTIKLPDTQNNQKPDTFKSVLGSNKKQIVIIVMYEDVPVIADKSLKFLLDILSACKLTLEDVAIINYTNNRSATFDDIATKFSSQTMLAFALKPQVLNLQPELTLLLVHEINDKKILFSPSLEEIESNLPLKKQFWLVLRKLFDV